ncbi:MAG: hypothetical protein J7L61_04790, partial [Thermoplasmata archaeon]|nr:hypothetical protein [Thermoplasmata archaeon]
METSEMDEIVKARGSGEAGGTVVLSIGGSVLMGLPPEKIPERIKAVARVLLDTLSSGRVERLGV